MTRLILGRHQLSSLIATGIDFSVLILCVEALKIWYVPATALGALVGGISNFFLNYYWVFFNRVSPVTVKMQRYFLILICSLLLNTLLVFLLTNFGKIEYVCSKVISAIIIGVCFNFQLHRYYVFK